MPGQSGGQTGRRKGQTSDRRPLPPPRQLAAEYQAGATIRELVARYYGSAPIISAAIRAAGGTVRPPGRVRGKAVLRPYRTRSQRAAHRQPLNTALNTGDC